MTNKKQNKNKKKEDKEEKEQKPFTFREAAAHQLQLEIEKKAGPQLHPLPLIPPNYRKWVLDYTEESWD